MAQHVALNNSSISERLQNENGFVSKTEYPKHISGRTFSTYNLCAEKNSHKKIRTFERIWMGPLVQWVHPAVLYYFRWKSAHCVYCVLSRNYRFSDILFGLSLSVVFCFFLRNLHTDFSVLNPISMRTQRL